MKVVFFTMGIGVIVMLVQLNAAHAGEFKVLRISPGQLWLEGPDCRSVQKQLHELAVWRTKVDHSPDVEEPSLKVREEDGGCSMNITEIVPRFVRELAQTEPGQPGPNCFNSVLVSARLVPSFRYSTADELNFWMRSPLCTEVAKNSPLEPGDILVTSNQAAHPLHAFVYISDELAFSKNGMTQKSPFGVWGLESVFVSYENFLKAGRLCRRKNVNGSDAKCELPINAYRCISFRDYVAKNALKLDPEAKSTMLELDQTERCLADAVLGRAPFTHDLFKNVLGILNILEAKIKEDAAEGLPTLMGGKLGQTRLDLWAALLLQIKSLKHQLGPEAEDFDPGTDSRRNGRN